MWSEATVADSGREGQAAPGPCSSALRAGGELELEAIARGAEASALDPEPRWVAANSIRRLARQEERRRAGSTAE
jgi:hypothetical protein